MTVSGQSIASIGPGLLVFVGVEKNDQYSQADRLLQRILSYRVFADKQGKMNLNVADVNGGLLIVPQFTLAADTNKGARPSFSSAAPPEQGQHLFNYFVVAARSQHSNVEAGQFGADMQVALVNNGPVTFLLRNE